MVVSGIHNTRLGLSTACKSPVLLDDLGTFFSSWLDSLCLCSLETYLKESVVIQHPKQLKERYTDT